MSSVAPTLLRALPTATPSAGAAAPVVDYRAMYDSMKAPELFSVWKTEKDTKERDRLIRSIVKRKGTDGIPATAYLSEQAAERERDAGLYPDPIDPQFAARLYEKREFYEARAVAAGVAEGDIDPCTSAAAEKLFELTPVQRIVSRFMHPLTPYNGLLLFHGVGVGKTCSAVTIAEQFLEVAPNRQVIVLVPQALQDNFKKTVFDMSKVSWDPAENVWKGRQCTGVSYLERLGLMNNPDEREVLNKVETDRRNRYVVSGYQAFANYIKKLLESKVPVGLTDPEQRLAAENEVLRVYFSNRLIIVDEAHNLRDMRADTAAAEVVATEAAEEAGADEAGAVVGEALENAGGKALNPFLRRIVLNAESLRLVLMTATPMYNSAPEIVLLLNYLIMNDHKTEARNLTVNGLFDKYGNIKDGNARGVLARAARAYVSYMRGENPYTFPLRIRPAIASANPVAEWPAISATRVPVVLDGVEDALNTLPLVFTEPIAGSPVDIVMRAASSRTMIPVAAAGGAGVDEEATVEEGPIRDTMLDLRMQIGNITYPNQLYGGAGWDNYFVGRKVDFENRKIMTFLPQEQEGGPFDVDSVFAGEGLRQCAPKIARIVESVRRARGISFIYSRYIKSGALPLAIALERAGFRRRMASGKLAPLLIGVKPAPGVCAICGEAHTESASADGHPFRQATYILLTSDDDISPNFAGLVRQAANWPEDPEWGPLGSNVKVIVGSQVASEGLDLKCVREMHIMDAWYHLNRTDQIIGRAIRYCSHTALRAVEAREGQPAMSYNNCLIYLHAIRGGDPMPYESADMYAYRIAIAKAQRVGLVQRLLKAHAWDCALELEAITFAGLPKRKQVDAQRRELIDYSIDDQDYTTYCDYQACRHRCAVTVAEAPRLNVGTFSLTDARRLLIAKQDAVRKLFMKDQLIVPTSVIKEIYADLPWEIASEAQMELLDGRRFRITRPDGVEGFLINRADYLVFQPRAISDTDIPMALRYAGAFQLRRHFMEQPTPVFTRKEERAVYQSARAMRTATAEATMAAATATATEKKKKTVAAPAGGAGLAPITEENTEVSATATASATASAAPAGVAEEAPPTAVVLPTMDAVMTSWKEWVVFVASGGSADIPKYLLPSNRIWKWILKQFAGASGVKQIAYRWWFDKVPDYTEQRAIMELALSLPVNSEERAALPVELQVLLATLDKKYIFISKNLVAYRLYNQETSEVEVWCRKPTERVFSVCSPLMSNAINKALGDGIILPDDVGYMFGFLAHKGKSNMLVFKTLVDVPTSLATKRTSGAECGNVSNMREHWPRVQFLHAEGRKIEELEPLIIPDDSDSWNEDGKKERISKFEYEHLKDMTHQPLCIYMEFLTRILDHFRAGGHRWFLNAAEAALSTQLKAKK